MADITLVNLNLLYMRTFDTIEEELHVPLGPLYLVSVLEQAGFEVDFRDYQGFETNDPFETESIMKFLENPAPILGVSCMANLLPFTLLALKEFKSRYPDVTVVIGGVGPTAVERQIIEKFDWIDIIGRGEGEITVPLLVKALKEGGDLSQVPGISYRAGDTIHEND